MLWHRPVGHVDPSGSVGSGICFIHTAAASQGGFIRNAVWCDACHAVSELCLSSTVYIVVLAGGDIVYFLIWNFSPHNTIRVSSFNLVTNDSS